MKNIFDSCPLSVDHEEPVKVSNRIKKTLFLLNSSKCGSKGLCLKCLQGNSISGAFPPYL